MFINTVYNIKNKQNIPWMMPIFICNVPDFTPPLPMQSFAAQLNYKSFKTEYNCHVTLHGNLNIKKHQICSAKNIMFW
jgi:hypothetical protein